MTEQESKKKLQVDASIPHLPTDLTYDCRKAVSGEGPRAYDWGDKPHRLVFDLCRQVEADADRIAKLEDKLAKAMGALRFYANFQEFNKAAITVLAEIEDQ